MENLRFIGCSVLHNREAELAGEADRLDAGFAAASHEDWRRLVEAALEGASFDEGLVSSSYDGIEMQPVYARAKDAPARPPLAHPGRWDIIQRIEHPDLDAANALIRADLDGGATGVEIVHAAGANAHGYGLNTETLSDLERLLDGVALDRVLIRIDCGINSSYIGALLAELVERRGIDPAAMRLHLASDPVSLLAVKGYLVDGFEQVMNEVGETARSLKDAGFAALALMPDGRAWHAAGASEAQELALTIASAVAFLKGLERHGLKPEAAVPLIGFSLAADADQLFTIAKIRALRRLWARVQKAAGLEPSPAHIHAETAWRMMTARAPYVNMPRATLAAFAAGAGGADSITVLPFTSAIGLPDGFARRIARNTQVILIEETNAHRVADPAAGSGALEGLSDALARKAWELFAGIEREGGMIDGLRSGRIQATIRKVGEARAEDIARRKALITGVSDFADLDEKPVAVLPAPSLDMAPAPAGAVERIDEALPRVRLAEPFEKLRAASDAYRDDTGARPLVFLARLGPTAEPGERATFAANIFALAGIAAVSDHGLATAPSPSRGEVKAGLTSVAAAFKASGARIACLCASDETYKEMAGAAAEALREAGAKALYLVGDPDADDAKRGIGSFIHVGCNVLEILRVALAYATGAKGD